MHLTLNYKEWGELHTQERGGLAVESQPTCGHLVGFFKARGAQIRFDMASFCLATPDFLGGLTLLSFPDPTRLGQPGLSRSGHTGVTLT